MVGEARLGAPGSTLPVEDDAFDLYADWRAEQELRESRRGVGAWAAAATLTLAALAAFGVVQTLFAG